MPMAIPILGAAFLAAGSVMTAVGVTAAIAGISLATIATVAGAALMAVSMLTMQVPKPSSAGTQLDTLTSSKAAVPVLYGRTATGGTVVYDELSGKENRYRWLAIALSAAGPIAGVDAAYANDVGLNFFGDPTTAISMVTSTSPASKKLYRNKFAQRWLVGEAPSPTTISQGFGSYGPSPKAPGKASGHALALVYADYDSDQFPQGFPKLLWTVRGVKVYDPRKDSTYPGGSGSQRLATPSTWAFSENPYLCALHWTLGKYENGRKVVGIGALPSEVDFAAFVRGANVADANNWKCGGVASTSDDKFAVLSTILAAGGGVPIARGAQISCFVNTPLTTTASIVAADVIRDVEIQNSASLRQRYNTVAPTYREPSQFWKMVSGEQVTSTVYIEEDAGFKASKEVEFTMVQQAKQAHQLATYNLVNSREMLTFTVGLKLRALSYRVGDAVTVNVPEIASGATKCLVINREYNPSDQVVTLTLKSENDAKHAFALGQSQIAPPTIALTGYDKTDLAAPESTAWIVTGSTLTSATGTKPIIRVGGARDNPYAAAIIVEYRPVGAADWQQGGTYSRDTTAIEISTVTSNTAYQVAISYRSSSGAVSDRTIYGPVTAGGEAFQWQAVTGPAKPQDGATVGAPPGTQVGGVPAEDIAAGVGAYVQWRDIRPAKVTLAKAGVTSSLDDAQNAKLIVKWTALTGISDYEVAVSKAGMNEWDYYPAGQAATATIPALANVEYDVRVRAKSSAGVVGDWSDTITHKVAKDEVAPLPPVDIYTEDSYGRYVIGWKNDAAADLVRVDIYSSETNDPATATLFASETVSPGTTTVAQPPETAVGLTRYFWLKSVDRSGNASPFSARVSATTIKIEGPALGAVPGANITDKIPANVLPPVPAEIIFGELHEDVLPVTPVEKVPVLTEAHIPAISADKLTPGSILSDTILIRGTNTTLAAMNTNVNDLISDTVLMPSEKPAVIRERDRIVAAAAALIAEAGVYSISTTALVNARDALTTYLNGLTPALTNTTVKTTVVVATHNARFSDYYAAESNLKVLVENAAKSRSDATVAAKNAAEGALATATTKASEAAASATQSSTSAGVASTAANAATLTTANGPILPSAFDEDGKYWGPTGSGQPTRASLAATPAAGITFVTVAGVGRVAQIDASAQRGVAPLGWMNWKAGQRYRIEAVYRAISGSTTARVYRASFSESATDTGSPNSARSTTTDWQTHAFEMTADAGAGTVYIRPWIRFEASAGCVVQVSSLSITDVTQTLAAAGSATAAASSASAANTSAGAAGSSASAADTAKTAAETARGQAQTFASNASGSADSAAGSASTAATQAGVSASSATNAANAQRAAELATQRGGVSTFEDKGKYFFLTANPFATTNSIPDTSFRNVSGVGNVYFVTNAGTSAVSSYPKTRKLLPNAPGRTYRATVVFRAIDGNVTGRSFGLLWQETGTQANFTAGTNTVVTPAMGWFTATHDFVGSTGAYPFVSMQAEFSIAAGATVEVRSLDIVDVTSEVAALGSANAAATSASSANTSATNAGQFATAASNSKTSAETAAGNASTSATQSSSSATQALASATAMGLQSNASFDAALVNWTNSYTGNTQAGGASGQIQASYQGASNVLLTPANSRADIAGEIKPISNARTYRITIRVYASVAGVPLRFGMHVRSDAAIGNTGGNVELDAPSLSQGWNTVTAEFGAGTVRTWASDKVWGKLFLIMNGPSPVSGQLAIDYAMLEDITESKSAATSATDAGTAATAATTAKTLAETARGQAQTFAANASTSADNAAGSASTATTQAGISASSAAAATQTVANGTILPSDFTNGGTYWSTTFSGVPTRASITASATGITFPSVSGIGTVAQLDGTSSTRDIAALGWMTYTPGRRFRVTARYRCLSGSTNGILYIVWLTSAGAQLGANNLTSLPAANTDWTTVSVEMTADPATTTAYLRPLVRVQTGSVMQVASLVIEDITTAAAAANSATAAANSASSANTSATNAGNSATAANNSAVAAASSFSGAQMAAANGAVLPNDFAQNGSYWASNYQGLPTRASFGLGNANLYFPTVSGVGTVAQMNNVAGDLDISNLGWLTHNSSKRYRLNVRARTTSGTAQMVSFMIGLTDTGTGAGSYPSRTDTVTTTWQTFTLENTTGFPGVEARALVRRTGSTSNGIIQIASIEFIDITSEAGAKVSADAAATSASTATTKAGEAGTSAAAASASAVTANTKAGEASSSASAASASATQASASQAAAETITRVAASLGTGSSIYNTVFADWVESSPVPANWANWAGTPPVRLTTGRNSPYALQFVTASGQTSQGIQQTVASAPTSGLSNMQPGWYIVEAEVELVAGGFTGAGILFRGLTSANATAQDILINFGTEFGVGEVGKSYTLRKRVQITNANTVRGHVFLMSQWLNFGASTAKTLNVYRVSVRPENFAEASVTTQAGSITALEGKTSAYWQTVANAGTGQAIISARVDNAGTANITMAAGEIVLATSATGNVFQKALVVDGAGNATLAAKLKAGAVETDHITANAVNSGKIAAGSIQTNHMVAGSINGDRIAANTLTADKIAANSITARELSLADLTNLAPNGDLITAQGFPTSGRVAIAADAANAYAGKANVLVVTPAASAGWVALANSTFGVEAGEQVYFEIVARAAEGAAGRADVQIRWERPDGSQTSTATVGVSSAATTWTRATVNATAPANSTQGRLQFYASNTAGNFYIGQIRIYRKNGANLIVDGSITTNHMAANSITAAKIAGGTITGNEIAANTTSASKLQISGENLFPDPYCQDINWWKGPSQGTFAETGRVTPVNASNAYNVGWEMIPAPDKSLIGRVGGSKGFWQLWSGNSNDGYRGTETTQVIAPSIYCKPSTTYEVGIGCTNGSNRAVNVYVQYFNAAGANTSTVLAMTFAAGDQSTILQRAKVTTNSAAVSIRIFWETPSGTAFTGFIDVGGVTLREAAGGTMIVDGTITGNLIAANAIQTSKLDAGAVTAEKIQSGAVTTDKMTANTINGDRITAGTLNASKIVAGSITTTQMTANTINGDRITANTLNASKIIAGTITTDRMTANTINGDRIQAGTLAADKIIANSISSAQIAAGAISADKLTIGMGGNLLLGAGQNVNPNSFMDINDSAGGAHFEKNGKGEWLLGSSQFSYGGGAVGDAWNLPDRSTWCLRQVNGTQYGSGYSDCFYVRPMAQANGGAREFDVEPGRTYEYSIYTGAHRCRAQVYLQLLDPNWNHIGYVGGDANATNDEEAAGGTHLGGYKRIWVRATMPANCRFVRIMTRKYNTKSGQSDSYLFMAKAMFAETSPAATTLMSWTPGSVTVIDGANIVTPNISAITANIGTLRTASSGQRVEISDNVIKVFDASNVLRVKLGDLSK
ncbi:hypothetical protein GR702_11565 [Novosphingobium sp. FGD1]|uniref:Fibronectin type-III domain-containing protein n=1 Tax=Novosphingobium silvae TaxID=2692619 RepID=A0A7X4GHM8_9SPHN|nr:hypothetical protein [Novosphingobium silvae]MYL98401.1 hypothetical protein [Novosphingobium silvae]